MPDFSHLHVHTQYSLLDGAAPIKGLVSKAKNDGMKAIAMTDHGNMFGAFQFVAEAERAGIKPIVGCEFYLVQDRWQKQFSREQRDNRYHQLLLAKDQAGYHNLAKLCSLGFIEGLYSKYPRIDKELILKYHEGLICTSCCIGAEIPQAILHKSEEEAEKVFKWWLDLFGDDFYVELQRHNLENIDGTGKSQEDVNQVLLRWARKHNVKVICTNDSHYVEQDDWNAHDILLCVNTGDKQSTPIGHGKGFRFGFPNDQFYFKSQAEMLHLFVDIPEALDNTNEIVDKITPPKIKRDILLPNFAMPEQFETEDDYLRHLSFEGAKQRYGEITSEVEERLNHELTIIKEMGFAGYFLIVQDFMAAARDLGVAVGPGRGSAAGSAVAFVIGITNIDPLKYKLLFERFLNPERVSMPDIDIDFDDEGRSRVIDWVIDKYGRNQVAQIITYGKMAAKSAIRDVARVIDLPLSEADMLAKMVPPNPGMTLDKAFNEVPELKDIATQAGIAGDVLRQAKTLEGSVRNTGIHAAGVIIAPDDITKYIPVCTAKDSDLFVTQFEGKYIEDAGMLKMDFLGLKTLTIIKDAIAMVRENYGVEIDPDLIPLDDTKTFELYQRGDTIGTFQFESEGMRMYLKELKPTVIEDLIAMNALYRPGPMQFIDTFIARKHGSEEVEYPHPLLEDLLKDTYGIMVYQEQIMQTAQILGGYSLGGADLLRRAMGKKKMDVMEEQKVVFIKGAKDLHQIDEKKSKEVFEVMMKFAEYGFNRSHSAAYSVVAFQTGYLKANYPGEYMASVLTHNMSDIKKVTFFMEECKRMKIPVLGPDVNESAYKFVVNKKGEIRFGLGAVKGVGEGAVESIIKARKEEGPFRSIFDLTSRIDLKSANRKNLESMALAGAFDCFEGVFRSQYFWQDREGAPTILEMAVKYGQAVQREALSAQQSLFGEASGGEPLPEPKIPQCPPWDRLLMLNREKEVTGIYISGHPLDEFKVEIDNFCNIEVSQLKDLELIRGKEVKFAGIVTEAVHRTTKNGRPFGLCTVEDFNDSFQIALFGEDYAQNKHFLVDGWFLYVKGKVVPRRYDQTQLEVKVHNISLLSDVRDKLAKSLTITVSYKQITEEWLARIEKMVQEYAGKCQLKLVLEDRTERIRVPMRSKSVRVNPSNELLQELRELGVKITIN